jgi:hypothetical protein
MTEAQPSLDSRVPRHQIAAWVLGKNTMGGEGSDAWAEVPAGIRRGIDVVSRSYGYLWRKRVSLSRRLGWILHFEIV